jgi:hypothetical protein
MLSLAFEETWMTDILISLQFLLEFDVSNPFAGIGRQSGQEETNQTIPTCDDAHDGESAVWAADRVHLLQTVANVAVELPCEAAADLAGELLDRLESFNMHTAEVLICAAGHFLKSL